MTGATGNVGSAVVQRLLAAGAQVRAGVRDPAAASLPDGAEAVLLDFERPETFPAAVAGIEGLFLVRPPAIARVGSTLNALTDAATEAGARHCVFLSVEGADRNRLLPHHRVERHLASASMGWTFLRPGHFAQNLTGPYLGDVRRGRLVLPAGDGRIAFVDTRDLAEVAANALLDPDTHAGEAYHLTGREAISFADLVRIVRDETGREVCYEPVGIPAYARHLRKTLRASPVRIAVLALLHAEIRAGKAAAIDPTLERLLGRPPRTVRDLVRDERERLTT